MVALGCAFAATVPAASPFAGKWKFDAAKSVVTGTTDSVAAAGPNAWKFTYGSFSWNVKADGTDQPTPFGNTLSLKVVSPAKWEFTNKTNGKLVSVDTWTLSGDGKSMTRTSGGKREDGTTFSDVFTMKRTASDKGFEDSWESSDAKVSWTDVVMEANGDAGIMLTVPAESIKVPLTLDGKESPISGPKVPPGMTTSTKAAGPRKLDVTTKMNGKVLDTETWEISPDGKTFTYTEHDAGEAKAMVQVFDKI